MPDEEGFLTWMGEPHAVDRNKVRTLIGDDAKTFLDVGCGAAPEFFGLKEVRPDIEYTGVDITPRLVDHCQKGGINALLGSANDIPFGDATFDVVHSRHVVEHMTGFEKPLSEFIRVAKQMVLVVFFIEPTELPNSEMSDTSEVVYYNRYSRKVIEDFLSESAKCGKHEWEQLGGHSTSVLRITIDQQ